MLNTVIEDWRDWDSDERSVGKKEKRPYQKWRDNLKAGLKRAKVKSGAVGITLPSTNYETYIFKKDGDIYVSTANNHDWNFAEIGTAEGPHGYGADDGSQDCVHKYVSSIRYFNVKNGLIHSNVKWARSAFSDDLRNECPSCQNYYGSYVLVGKRKICSRCYRGIIGTKKTIDWPSEKEEKELKKLQKLIENKPPVSNVITTLELGEDK